MGRSGKKRPFYKNLDDTIEEVGITRRQLSYWRKNELFKPEFGPKAKFFTPRDIQRLEFLKRLIDDLGLPIAIVRRLVAPYDDDEFELAEWNTFLDVENGVLVNCWGALDSLIATAVAGEVIQAVEEWFLTLGLHLLHWTAQSSRSWDIYEARRKELLDRLDRMDRAARIERLDIDEHQFSPRHPDELVPGPDEAELLIDERERRLTPVWAAEKRKLPRF